MTASSSIVLILQWLTSRTSSFDKLLKAAAAIELKLLYCKYKHLTSVGMSRGTSVKLRSMQLTTVLLSVHSQADGHLWVTCRLRPQASKKYVTISVKDNQQTVSISVKYSTSTASTFSQHSEPWYRNSRRDDLSCSPSAHCESKQVTICFQF